MKRTQNKRDAHDDSCVVFGIDYSRNGRHKIYRVTEKGEKEDETNFCYDVGGGGAGVLRICGGEGLIGELKLNKEPKQASEYDNAVHNLIDAPEKLEIKDAEDNVIWSQAAYSFLHNYKRPRTP